MDGKHNIVNLDSIPDYKNLSLSIREEIMKRFECNCILLPTFKGLTFVTYPKKYLVSEILEIIKSILNELNVEYTSLKYTSNQLVLKISVNRE